MIGKSYIETFGVVVMRSVICCRIGNSYLQPLFFIVKYT